jgi:hypothetical protein
VDVSFSLAVFFASLWLDKVTGKGDTVEVVKTRAAQVGENAGAGCPSSSLLQSYRPKS